MLYDLAWPPVLKGKSAPVGRSIGVPLSALCSSSRDRLRVRPIMIKVTTVALRAGPKSVQYRSDLTLIKKRFQAARE